tara:strand:+ start:116 stop:565 length:450 start_codon:yes stop_codon:yes gene_type:complete
MGLIMEDIMAFNWERAADIGGKITTILCFAAGLLGLFQGQSTGIMTYTIFSGFLLAVLELPVIYFCFPKCKRVRSEILETLHFDQGPIRATVYCLTTILMLKKPLTIAVIPGSLIVITSFLYIMNFFVKRSEDAEAAAKTSYNPVPGER